MTRSWAQPVVEVDLGLYSNLKDDSCPATPHAVKDAEAGAAWPYWSPTSTLTAPLGLALSPELNLFVLPGTIAVEVAEAPCFQHIALLYGWHSLREVSDAPRKFSRKIVSPLAKGSMSGGQ